MRRLERYLGWLLTLVVCLSVQSYAKAEAEEGKSAEAAFEDLEGVGAKHEEEEEGPLSLALDLVLGFGKFKVPWLREPAATQNATKVTTESFVLAAGYEVAEHVGIGARLPLTFGTVSTTTGYSSSVFAVGNVELEGEYGMRLAPHAELSLSLGVTVPMAQGEEYDARSTESDAKIDRGFVQRAAAASRGFEDEALYELKRLGVIPKIMLDYRAGALRLRPFAKVETLISTASEAEHSVLLELLLGTYVGASVGEHFELGARIWTDLVLAGGGGSVGVVEPQVALLFGDVRVIVAGILPFAGVLTDPYFAGIRLGVAARL